MGAESTGCCGGNHEEFYRIQIEGKGLVPVTNSSQYSSIVPSGGIKVPSTYNSRSYNSRRNDDCPFQICAENIEYVTTFLDPKRRILKEVRVADFTESDYLAINAYIKQRGSLALNSDEDLGVNSGSHLEGDELVRRDIAYFIRRIQAKKHLQNDFVIGANDAFDSSPEQPLDDLD